MDKLHSVLTSFPPPSGTATTTRTKDEAIKTYIAALQKLSTSAKKYILDAPAKSLQLIDPATNSIGYLFVLDVLLNTKDATPAIERSALLDATLSFLVAFDPIQIRYVGSILLVLLEVVGSGKLFPPRVSVEILASAILRIDPSGSLFTSSHLVLAKYAYETAYVEPALQVIGLDITSYPIVAKDPRPLCTPDLPATSFISHLTGLTEPVRASMVLEYDFVCGLIYMSKHKWLEARKAMERVVSYPSKDKGVSKIMTEAYKKWLLIGLLSEGEGPSFPSYTGGSAKSTYNVIAAPYRNVVSLFTASNAGALKEEVDGNQSVWVADGNESLIREVQAAYQQWQILNLRDIYQQVSISKIQKTTSSAQTGQPLVTKDEVTALLESMISSQFLKGQIEKGEDGEDYLTFQDAKEWSSEEEFAKEIARAHRSITTLSGDYKATNERLTNNKDYVRFLVKEQKRQDKEDPDGGFDAQIDEEDLMDGIVSHG